MPRNGSGVMSKPAGTTAVPNTPIESAKYNATIDDIIQDLNDARPIVAGGTGATTAASARTGLGFSSDAGNFGKQGASIASAATTDLGTATGEYVTITGTTTITSFGTAPAGTMRTIKFASQLILTNNANIVLRNDTSTTTFSGAIMKFVCEGAGVWTQVCNTPSRASWTPTIASSAGTLTAASASGYYYRNSGVVFITVLASITTNGTGSQSIVISLPFPNNSSFACTFVGRENNVSGKTVTGVVAAGSSSVSIANFDNTYPGSSGATIRLTGSYIV